MLYHVYQEAIKLYKQKELQKASQLFMQIVSAYEKELQACAQMNELYIAANSCYNLWCISQYEDYDIANKAIALYKLYFDSNKDEIELEKYIEYIMLLDLTWKYAEELVLLNRLLESSDPKTQLVALQFCANYAFIVYGLMEKSEYILRYKKLIELTEDTKEKTQLKKNLEIILDTI